MLEELILIIAYLLVFLFPRHRMDDRLVEVNGQLCTNKEVAFAAFTSTGTENLNMVNICSKQMC